MKTKSFLKIAAIICALMSFQCAKKQLLVPIFVQERGSEVITGALIIVRFVDPNDFQWSVIDSGTALYPGYVLKRLDGKLKKYPSPPLLVDSTIVFDFVPQEE